jgi:hypothetical protein
VSHPVTDATFARDVLDRPLPTIVLFGSPRDAASLLARAAASFADQLMVGEVDVDDSFVAEQYNVNATPTLLVFEHGEPTLRLVGFAASGLLTLLCADVARGNLASGFWRPTEEAFERAVIVPLIEGWGWSYTRQAGCKVAGRRGRGRIDFLVSMAEGAAPLTLFENKRLITSQREALKAAEQAQGYAEALAVPSFVVAAPAGMWVYSLLGGKAVPRGAFSSLEVQQRPELLRALLVRLGDATGTATAPHPDRSGALNHDHAS